MSAKALLLAAWDIRVTNVSQERLSSNAVFARPVRIDGLSGPDGPVTLGFRAEDASVAEQGQIAAPVYTMELLGDATMITVRAGGALVAVKAGKEYRVDIGAPVSVSIPAAICHLFDSVSGARFA